MGRPTKEPTTTIRVLLADLAKKPGKMTPSEWFHELVEPVGLVAVPPAHQAAHDQVQRVMIKVAESTGIPAKSMSSILSRLPSAAVVDMSKPQTKAKK